jgi:hypothetical protein
MIFRILRPTVSLLLFAGWMGAADPELMSLLMPDARVVAGVNVDQARISPFGQFVLSQMPAADARFANFTAMTGFDPRRDLREVLMATVGRPGQQGLVLARGTFDAARIFAAAQAAGHTIENYNGIQIVTGKEEALTHAVAFLGKSIAVAGDIDNVHGAIDRRNAASSSIDPALAAKVGQLSEMLDVWSISTVPLATVANPKLADNRLNGVLSSDVMKAIQQTSGGVKFGATVELSGQAVADSSQNATALADVVRFLANMLQINAPSSSVAGVTALVQSLNVQANGNTVSVAASIPEQELESILRAARQNKGAHNEL